MAADRNTPPSPSASAPGEPHAPALDADRGTSRAPLLRNATAAQDHPCSSCVPRSRACGRALAAINGVRARNDVDAEYEAAITRSPPRHALQHAGRLDRWEDDHTCTLVRGAQRDTIQLHTISRQAERVVSKQRLPVAHEVWERSCAERPRASTDPGRRS